MQPTPLFSSTVKLEKFPGKGGWTYARLPGVKKDPHAWFGWIRVRGSIDDFEIRQYHLMPMGNGELFLPVRAEIRKKIKKEVGDMVSVTLYREEEEVYIPEEFQACLELDPSALRKFNGLGPEKRREIIRYIYALKNEENRSERIAMLMNNGFKLP